MGTVSFSDYANMASPSIWYGSVYYYDDNEIWLYNGTYGAIYSGYNFTYSNGALVGGTLTGYIQARNISTDYLGNLTYTEMYRGEGFSVSAATAYYYIQTAKDPSGFLTYLMSGADTINGSLYNDILIGFSGIDTIYGNSGADYLYGNSGNDALLGGNGDDFLVGGEGNDYLIGGAGTSDCAGYFYDRTTYSITYSNGYYYITDNSNVEGTDTVSDVEYFSFNGAIISASDIFSPSDATAPTVSIFSPADGASSVSVGSNIVLTFSEAVTKGTGSIQLRVGSATGTVFETFDAASSSRLTFSDSTLTIDPTNSLAGGTNYYVTLAAGSVKDTAGNSYIGTTIYDLTTAQSTVDYTAYIEAIYLAYYGRPADVTGLVYWNTALNTVNGDLASIINSFGTAAEATALYSSSSNVAKINAIYMALFNRPADAEGLVYYAGLLDNGAKSQASIALDILNGSTGDDLALILKKLQVSADFTSAMKSDATFMIAYAGNTAAATARSMLSAVTLTSDDSSVVDTTLNTIQTITTDVATLSAQTFTLSYAGANAGNDLAPETAGRDYYVGQITTHSKTVGQVLVEISDSAENKLAVADLIGTGIEYIPWVG